MPNEETKIILNPTVEALLAHPEELKKKKPFKRGLYDYRPSAQKSAQFNEVIEAQLPTNKWKLVSQDEFLAELDPQSHKVLYDENIPSITMKLNNGNYATIEYQKMAVAYQRMIRDKHVLHLCGYPMQFTLLNQNPSEKENADYAKFKQYWELRNMDGVRTKMVSAQKSVGDAGLLFYLDYKGRIKARLISYEDGYVICSHNNDDGDRILESIYYMKDGVEYIDSYDDTYFHRYKMDHNIDGVPQWILEAPVKHGFSEIPLVTKRGQVAWDNVQSIIEVYEVIYNIFLVIQKRHGWGILYVKGQFSDSAKKIAGAIVLNDTSIDGNGSAEFKTPPSPQHMIDTLGLMEETIQKGSGSTFLLPKDVKSSGDISAQAIMLTQSLDIENALQGVIEWQNVADKMARLFKEGLARELVNNGEHETAVTDFANLNISAKFKVWRPQNDSEYNEMLIQLRGAGLISGETGIEKNTVSSPDEKQRVKREADEKAKAALELAQQQAAAKDTSSTSSSQTQTTTTESKKEGE